MSVRIGLTKYIYDYCREYVKEHGYFPSTTEIGREFNAQRSVVMYHIKLLIDMGYIETDTERNESRAYRIVGLKVVDYAE